MQLRGRQGNHQRGFYDSTAIQSSKELFYHERAANHETNAVASNVIIEIMKATVHVIKDTSLCTVSHKDQVLLDVVIGRF